MYIDPNPEMLQSTEFNALWKLMKDWDICAPELHGYRKYTSCSGTHIATILQTIKDSKRLSKIKELLRKKTIYIDMDGTICDYTKSYNKYKSEYEYPQSKIGFFRDLEPIEGAIEAFKYLEEHFNVWTLTRASHKNINCYSEKAEWVLKYLGFNSQEHLIICPDKSLVKGDYLIDDMGCDGQDRFNGKWLKFGSKECLNWNITLDIIKKENGLY